MLHLIHEGKDTLRIADDIWGSPSYSVDIAHKIRELVEEQYAYGVYHIINEGKVSLYELMREVVENLGLDVRIEKASYRDFPSISRKNKNTPLKSEKIKMLRPWRQAIKEYCRSISNEILS